jgi:shikimate 5-dehydrogenase
MQGEADRSRETQRIRNMVFVGVTATRSSINRVFPKWGPLLGIHGARLIPIDIPLGEGRERLRDAVRSIRDDESIAGALVTSHKVGVFEACGDLFDHVDETATSLGEISCISKPSGRLVASALDVMTSGLALGEIPGLNPWPTSADALIFGAGGAATALMCHLGRQPSDRRPERVLITARRQARLDHIQRVHDRLGLYGQLQTVLASSTLANDRALTEIGERSLVVNATGLGKDSPGSPITDAEFPFGAIAWDLNYRGDLLFLEQARRQAADRSVQAVDGWGYFLHAWIRHIAKVYDLLPSHLETTFERLATAAAAAR